MTAQPLDGIAAVLFDLDDTLIGSRVAWLGRILVLLYDLGHHQEDDREVATCSTPRPSPILLSSWTWRVVTWCGNRIRRDADV